MCVLNFVLFFRVNYRCNYGDSVYVVGNIEALGNWNPTRALKLDWSEGHNWMKKLKVMHENTQLIEYKYFVSNSEIYTPIPYIRWEADSNRFINLFTTSKLLIKLDDEWEHINIQIAIHYDAIKKYLDNDRHVLIYTNLDYIKSGHEMKLKKRELGNGTKEEWFWTVTLRAPSYVSTFNYRYKLIGKSGDDIIADRANRKFLVRQALQHANLNELYVLKCSARVKYDFYFTTCLNYDVITGDIINGAFPQNVNDIKDLETMGVKGVLNLQTFGDMTRLGVDWEFLQNCYQQAGITVEHFPIPDMNLEELRSKIHDAAELLDKLLKEGKVYVHCTSGRHRSPHTIIYYLCCYRNYELKHAVELVKSKRSKVKVKVFEEIFLRKSEKNDVQTKAL